MPLPTDLELQTPQQKDWTPITPDVYQVEITGIEYKEIDNHFKKKPEDPDKKNVMEFEFTIIEEGEHYGRKLWQKMAPTKPLPPRQNGKSSWVWRIASALTGHAITQEEGESYTSAMINDFISKQLRITVSQSEPKDGKVYNNIDSVLGAKQQLPKFDPTKVKEESSEVEAHPSADPEEVKVEDIPF